MVTRFRTYSALILLGLAGGCVAPADDVVAEGIEGTGGALTPPQGTAITGLYRAASDHLLAIRGSSGGAYVVTDFKTGLARRVTVQGAGVYGVGPAIGVAEPIELLLTLGHGADGRVESLRLAPAPGQAATEYGATTVLEAEPCCDFDTLPHSFESEGLRLAGTLYLPAGDGPHPAAVWVHGSGPVTRAGAGTWPLFMVAHGFAVLAVDKRGVGESEGSYRLADGGRDNYPHMRRRSLDVAAAVRSLAADPRIHADRIGLIGASQAGWVIPMAARHADIAFTITISGGATPIDVEGRFSELAGESTDGGSGVAIEEIYAQLRDYRPRGFDFRDEFAAQSAPGLWLYGDNDRVNPTQLAVEVIEEVRRAHGKDFTVLRWPRGNHSLQISETGDLPEGRRLGRLVPGLHASISRWLTERGLPGQR